MEIKIRKPKIEDLDDISKIFSDWYVNSDGIVQEEEVFYWVSKVEKSINQEIEMEYLVAVDASKKVYGIIGWRSNLHKILIPFATKKAVELYDLFILKKYQNLGIGKKLIESFISEIKGLYDEVVFVSAERWQKAWSFYDKLGFNRIGYTNLNGEKFVVFQKDLFLVDVNRSL